VSELALLVDVKANALDDGPGIRSVVFLKGCPLSCTWCHNPECISAVPQLSYDATLCIDNAACRLRCPEDALRPDAEGRVDRARCTACFECVDHCPSGALARVGHPISAADLVAELARDQAFFENSGGG